MLTVQHLMNDFYCLFDVLFSSFFFFQFSKFVFSTSDWEGGLHKYSFGIWSFQTSVHMSGGGRP